MFGQCRAFIIATRPAESRVLELTAARLGFGEIVSSIGGATGRPLSNLTFFFIDYRVDDQSMADIIATIRVDRRGKLRYSPILLLIQDGSTARRLKYVRFGFDDVIALPLSLDALASRLAIQLNSDRVYLETKDYFGPDRRRLDAGAELRIGTSVYTRVLFERNPSRGVHVIQREERGYRFRPQPSADTHFMPKLFGQAAR